LPPSTISHYRIIRQLGSGGMGEVFLAEDTTLGRKVAIKMLPERSVGSDPARQRLINEAKAAAALDHPNICAIHEVGAEDDRVFIVMQ
jgi:serine/threonine protein kinase